MLPSSFDRETMLDLSVNMIPLGILMFFIVAYGLFNPFGWNSIISSLQFGILIISFVLLTILTYYAGKAVSEAEAEMEGEEEHSA